MVTRLARAQRAVPVALGIVTLAGVAALFAWDARPALFPAGAHAILGALPLAMIAVAYLLYQAARRPSPAETAKAITLAIAFLFWSANQFWPDIPQSTVFNDIAIGLFVLDLFLVIVGWPAFSGDESFGESAGPAQCCPNCAARQLSETAVPPSTTRRQPSSL
jgi:hypothetical protein